MDKGAYTHHELNALISPDELRAYDENMRLRMVEMRSHSEQWMHASDESLCPIDLDLCHRAMHWRLDVLAIRAGLQASGPSILVGIPVSIAPTDSSEISFTLPESYRGGIWIYAIVRGDWQSKSERLLLDLARLLSMLYLTRYSQSAGEQSKIEGTEEARRILAHQIKDVGDAAGRG